MVASQIRTLTQLEDLELPRRSQLQVKMRIATRPISRMMGLCEVPASQKKYKSSIILLGHLPLLILTRRVIIRSTSTKLVALTQRPERASWAREVRERPMELLKCSTRVKLEGKTKLTASLGPNPGRPPPTEITLGETYRTHQITISLCKTWELIRKFLSTIWKIKKTSSGRSMVSNNLVGRVSLRRFLASSTLQTSMSCPVRWTTASVSMAWVSNVSALTDLSHATAKCETLSLLIKEALSISISSTDSKSITSSSSAVGHKEVALLQLHQTKRSNLVCWEAVVLRWLQTISLRRTRCRIKTQPSSARRPPLSKLTGTW